MLIELKGLIELCQFEGHKNIRALLVPWDKFGFVLICKSPRMAFILRTKSAPRPRVFKSIDTAIGICRQVGFPAVTIQFVSEKFDFEMPPWLKDEDDDKD